MLESIKYNLGLNLTREIPDWFSKEKKELEFDIEKNEIKTQELEGEWYLSGYEGIDNEVTAAVVNNNHFFKNGVAKANQFIKPEKTTHLLKAYKQNIKLCFNEESAYEEASESKNENCVIIYLSRLENVNLGPKLGVPFDKNVYLKRDVGIIFVGDYFKKEYNLYYLEDMFLLLCLYIYNENLEKTSQQNSSLLNFVNLSKKGYFTEINNTNNLRYFIDFLFSYTYNIESDSYFKNLKASKYNLIYRGGLDE